jgi:hypothetical protein
MTIKGTATGRWLAAVALIGSIAVLGGCSASDDDQAEVPESSAAADPANPGDAALPEPDLEGLPDVVAVVNGTEIGKNEFAAAYETQFAQAAAQAQIGGQDVDQDLLKASVAENLVSTELLRQEADSRGIEATPEARSGAIEDLLQQTRLSSEEELREAFADQGLDNAEFDARLVDQVRIDALLTQEAGDTTPTDQEVEDAYDAARAEQEAAGGTATPIPPLEDVRPQIESQLAGAKTSEATQALIAQLREDADVTVTL